MLFCTHHEHIRLNTYTLQFLYTVLSWLCLQLTCSLKIRNICQVKIDSTLAQFPLQLANSLKEWSRLNVTNSTTNLSNHKVIVILLPQKLNITFDFVRNMRNNLNSLTQVVATTLLVNDALIDTSRSHRVGFCGLNTCEALIVTEVEVGLHTILCYVALTVLVRVQRTWVNVDVRIKLLNGNVVTSCLKKLTD